MLRSEILFGLKNNFIFFLAIKISPGLSSAVEEFYMEAERKTTSIRIFLQRHVVKWYGAFLAIPFIYTVIVKIIIEKCSTEPITWHVPVKAR